MLEIRSRALADLNSLMGVDFLTSFSIYPRSTEKNVIGSVTTTGILDVTAMIRAKVRTTMQYAHTGLCNVTRMCVSSP